jgi:hypothetical protein
MVYMEDLAQRVREVLQGNPDLEEKVMFGGVGFLIGGNMACGVIKEELIVRVGPDAYEEALAEPHTKVFDLTGKPMRGWVVVTQQGNAEQAALRGWVLLGVKFARSLPPK